MSGLVEAELSGADTRALAGGIKPRRWGSLYVAEHRLLAMRSYLQTIVVTSVGNPLLYLFGFGVGLARLVTADVGDGGIPHSYLAFVAPALLASAAVTVAAEESTYPVMMGFKWNPIFYAMNAAPLTGRQIVNGLVISISARVVPTVAIYYAFMLLFGAVPQPLGALDILVAAFTGMSVALVIMAFTSTITEDKGQMAMIMRFGILPMFLFSGTFFPLSQLPLFLQWIGWISPLWHGTQLGRVFAYGMTEPLWLTVVHVAYPLALGIFGWWSTSRTVTRRLNG
ncbi:MAG: type transporter [Glaciihabitans sp.]|jgi:lipooligosaccharide transport system permease protein|nr:type transporter [Glaciihabitans sp.]MDQ1556546.1 lipooligosaccharide transport system permease protein [Actinomycetota bacterium]